MQWCWHSHNKYKIKQTVLKIATNYVNAGMLNVRKECYSTLYIANTVLFNLIAVCASQEWSARSSIDFVIRYLFNLQQNAKKWSVFLILVIQLTTNRYKTGSVNL